MRDLELAIVVSPREWAERLHRFVVDHGGARVRTRVMRPDDALEEAYDALLIDDSTSFLTRRLIQQIQSSGRSVVGVFDAAEFPEGRERLRDLGVDVVVDAGASPEEFLRAIAEISPAPDVPLLAEAKERSAPAQTEAAVGQGILVVGGPSGGVGVTELAIGIAAARRYAGETVVLVDGNDQAPAIAQRLGLGLHPNLRTAVDALQHRTGGLFGSLTFPRHVGVEVLAGLPNPRDWLELRSGDVVEVVREIADVRSRVVVDIGNRIEDLSLHGGLDRNGLGRALLKTADAVVAVGLPTPVGVARLLEWLADAQSFVTEIPVHLVVNRSGRSKFKEQEVAKEILRSYQPASLTFVPEDRRVEEAAWAGELVASGPFTRSLARLADRIVTEYLGAPA